MKRSISSKFSIRKPWIIATVAFAAIAWMTFVRFHPSGPGAVGAPGPDPGEASSSPLRGAETTTSTALSGWLARIAAAPAAEMEKLFQQAMEIVDPQERAKVMAELVRHWVSIDLKGLIAFVDAMQVHPSGYGDIWKILAPALMDALPKLDDETASLPNLKSLVRRMVAYLSVADPDGALAWAQQWLSGELLDSARAKIATQIAATRPQDAIRILESIQQPSRRVDALIGMGDAFGRTDADRALQWAASNPSFGERPYAMASVLQAMAEKSPERAAREFERYRAALNAEYLAEVEKDRAMIPVTPANSVEGDLGNREVLASPVNPQLNLLNDAGLAIAEQWALTDPGAALKWADGIPSGRLKAEVVDSALTSWAAVNGADAAAYYNTMPTPNPATAESLYLAWAKTNPVAAAQYSLTISNPEIRTNAVSGVVTGWINSGGDLNSIAQWVGALPDTAARDVGQGQLADAFSLENPTAAWQQAKKISDPAQRSDALETAFAALLESSPTSAKKLLASAKLSASDVATLQQMLQTVAGK